MSHKKRLFLTLGLVFGGLLVLASIACVVLVITVLMPMLRERVVEEAKARGIELGFDDVELSWNHLSVERARFRLVGVRGIAGTVQRIDITTSGFEPTGIALEGLHLELLGSVPSLILETTEWTKNYPEAYALPLSAVPVSVRWRSTPEAQPWLGITGGQVGRTVDGGNFKAQTANVAGIVVGPVGTSWTKEEGQIELGLGKQSLKEAPVSIQVAHALSKPTASIKLKPVAATRLAAPLGVKLPVEGVTVSSEVELEFSDQLAEGPINGTLDVKLDGYVPPHPRELDGFVFGKATTFSSKLSITPDKKTLDLSETKVQAGAFKLKGHGQVQRHPDHARLRLELIGFLSCSDLAGAAAETHLGQALSKLPKLIARQTLQGSVGVTVKVDADSRDLQAAKVLKLIGVGCGLKPLRAPTPEELEAFARELPGFVGELPSLAERVLPKELLPRGAASGFNPPKLPLPEIKFERKPQQEETTKETE